MPDTATNTGYIPFSSFPTPLRLKKAHEEYLKSAVPLEFDKDGVLLPFPPENSSRDVLNNSYFRLVDAHAKDVRTLSITNTALLYL